MTYKEYYMQCESLESLLEKVEKDIVWAKMFNPNRINVIDKAAEEVISIKFTELNRS